jgi:hypothetical protein
LSGANCLTLGYDSRPFRMKKRLPRRDFIKLAAASVAVGPFFNFYRRTFGNPKTLRIAKWAHFLPEYDAWFENEWAKQWGEKNNTNVIVDNVPLEDVHQDAAREVAAGKGHDIFMFPWPPAEFRQHAIDHTEIYQNVSMNYGSIPQISYKSTFSPKTKTHFAFADFWVPSPFHYYQDLWAEVNMPLGPVHYGSLRTGAKRIREKLGIACGLSFSPTLEGNVSANTLLYAFHGQILDGNGDTFLNKTGFTVTALNYVKLLSQDAGTPDEFTWGPGGNAGAQDLLQRERNRSTASGGKAKPGAGEKHLAATAVARPIRCDCLPTRDKLLSCLEVRREHGGRSEIPGGCGRRFSNRIREEPELQLSCLPESASQPDCTS